MNILNLVEEFYALEAILAMLVMNDRNSFQPMRHSHERWHRDLIGYRKLYTNKLASAIFDYTVMVVAGELRHCSKRASMKIPNYPDDDVIDRDSLYDLCTDWSSNSILEAGVTLFNEREVSWEDSYGGYKWMLIAKAGLYKDKLDDVAFVDHCVDLSHNNSVYFDKGAGIFSMKDIHQGYMNFLDKKRICDPELLLTQQGKSFNVLLQRAINLEIFKRPALFSQHRVSSAKRDEDEERILKYTPCIWGNKNLSTDYEITKVFADCY